MKVRLCDKNKGQSKTLKKLTEEMPDLDVKVKKCLDLCGDCSKAKVARVDGKKVVAGDTDELYDKIRKNLEDN